MYTPWAIPNDPRIALANMNRVFPAKETGKAVLIAENVEIDMETLRKAQCISYHPIARERAHQQIVEAVLKGLGPEDRQRLEAYVRGEQTENVEE